MTCVRVSKGWEDAGWANGQEGTEEYAISPDMPRAGLQGSVAFRGYRCALGSKLSRPGDDIRVFRVRP